MHRRMVLALLACAGLLWARPPALALPASATLTGSIGGSAYAISVPSNWNRTLILYSHGYVAPGEANPAPDIAHTSTGAWLLAHHYALAASAYSTSGWAVQQALHDQIVLLDFFTAHYGRPHRTIAWGHSLGGMITAGLLQLYPDRFDGGLPMCGVLAGGVAAWNSQLDAAFALKTLLAPGPGLQISGIANATLNVALAALVVNQAQRTTAGRARLALVAALGDIPGWYSSNLPAPAPDDYAAQEQHQYQWLRAIDAAFFFDLRAELEGRAGGNPSWNQGVVYQALLARSAAAQEVRALYARAGLSLAGDLRTLQQAAQITASPAALAYLRRYINFDGRIRVPVLTVHTIGDGLVPVEHEAAYADVVRAAGNAALLRQAYVARAGHCAFTSAEMIAAFQALLHRLDTGHWDSVATAPALDHQATALGPNLNSLDGGAAQNPPAFVPYSPSPFLRPYDSHTAPVS